MGHKLGEIPVEVVDLVQSEEEESGNGVCHENPSHIPLMFGREPSVGNG